MQGARAIRRTGEPSKLPVETAPAPAPVRVAVRTVTVNVREATTTTLRGVRGDPAQIAPAAARVAGLGAVSHAATGIAQASASSPR